MAGPAAGAERVLTLLTDFGLDDYYVAAVKGTVLRLAPGTSLVDLSHGVPPGDVETATFLLTAAAGAFPAGTVHLAVVDPGVGSSRRVLAAERDGHRFVAPDNGLLTPFLDGARLHAVERPGLFLAGPSETFHGRDRFAPVAAYLLRGEPLAALGPPVPDPVRLEISPPRRSAGELHGQVVHVDRFGNLVTDIPSDWLGDGPFEAWVDGHRVDERVSHYAALATGQPGVLTGSVGTLELSLRGEDLAAHWGVGRRAAVRILLRRGTARMDS